MNRQRLRRIRTVGLVIVTAAATSCGGAEAEGERATITEQGANEEVMAEDGALLVRRVDGIEVTVNVPTPPPGSYEYPTADMVPPWAPPHPEVSPGTEDQPEAFTMWVIIFNNPDLCTDAACDADDLLAGSAAKGGVFQADGRIAYGAEIEFAGTLRLGQSAATGAAFENPVSAEIHIAIAPHGRALSGEDLWRQLNGPVGNPGLWWSTSFLPDA